MGADKTRSPRLPEWAAATRQQPGTPKYATGRYAGDPPVAFTRDILAAAASRKLARGLYAGCGIQVFQHGTRGQAHRQLAEAGALVAPGGLLCVRVNACRTDVQYWHERHEEHPDGSYTVRYLAGPKAGLDIHFFAAGELAAVVGGGFREVLPPRLDSTRRTPPATGQWSQWEAIWQREPVPADTACLDRHMSVKAS